MNMLPRILAVIPARYGSTRFPGKPLALIQNKPMIQWVWERTMQSKVFTEVIIATDDQRILDCALGFGANAVLTSNAHPNGTSRCVEIAKSARQRFDAVVNVQGDEPFISDTHLRELAYIISKPDADIATLMHKSHDREAFLSPNVVKVVADRHGKALYFSRAAIPYHSIEGEQTEFFRHIGLYAFKWNVLLSLSSMPDSAYAKLENLEQLQWLQNGLRIEIQAVAAPSLSVDTPEDLVRANELALAF